jgi:hypothetical protein
LLSFCGAKSPTFLAYGGKRQQAGVVYLLRADVGPGDGDRTRLTEEIDAANVIDMPLDQQNTPERPAVDSVEVAPGISVG